VPSVTPRFPWLFGPEAEGAIRQALELRYRLLPLYYSLAHELSRTGIPLMRPMAMEFPNDPHVADISDQWMMGDRLMAAPVLQPGDEREVYLPRGTWYRFQTAQRVDGFRTITEAASLHEIPVYVRAGSILTLGPVLQTTAAAPGGPLDLQIYSGGNATFTLSEDDGETMGYASGAVRRTTFSWDDASRRLTWNTDGPFSGPAVYKTVRIELFGPVSGGATEMPLSASGEWTAK
jgi:alpha-glucosidase